ncbi:restin homolog [Paramacrobiotus metropolitanus]|uniref:restin homolog n=1 Tax=Paramacrobiotus metropolitanus TaxID=2943436 RepID=UPI002445EC28|nr:restin homolog [Paramacrobiotus metropolitanus]
MQRLKNFAKGKKETSDEPSNGYTQLSGTQNGSSHAFFPVPGSSEENLEGFLCPSCHAKFGQMDALLNHVPLCRGPGTVMPSAQAAQPSSSSSQSVQRKGSTGVTIDSEELLLKINEYDALKEGNELLRDELRSAHQQQQSLNEQLEQLKLHNDELLRKMSMQDRRLSHAKSASDDQQFEKLAAERLSSKAEADTFKTKISALEDEKHSLESSIANLRQTAADNKTKHEAEVNLLRGNIEIQKATISKMQSESEVAKSVSISLTAATAEVTRLRSEAARARQRVVELEASTNELSSSLSAAQAALDLKEKEFKQVVTESTATTSANTALSSTVEDLRAQIASMTTKLEHEKVEHERRTAEILAEHAKLGDAEIREKEETVIEPQDNVVTAPKQIEREKSNEQEEAREVILRALETEKNQLAQALLEQETVFNSQLENARKKETESSQLLEKYTTQIKEMENVRDNAERNLVLLQNEKSSLQQRVTDLEASNDNLSSALSAGQTALDLKDKELTQILAENSAVALTSSALSSAVEELQVQVGSLTAKLEDERKSAELLAAEQMAKNKEVLEKEESIIELRKNLDGMSVQLERQKVELQDQSDKLKQLEISQQTLETEKNALAQTLSEKEAAFSSQLDRARVKEEESAKLLETHVTRIKEVEVLHGDTERSLLQLRNEKKSLEQRFIDLEVTNNSLSSSLSDAKAALDLKENELKQILDEKSAVASASSALSSTVADLQAQVDSLTAKLENERTTAEMLAAEQKSKNSELQKREEMMDKLQKDLADALQQVERQKLGLQEQTDKVKQITALQRTLETEKSQLAQTLAEKKLPLLANWRAHE